MKRTVLFTVITSLSAGLLATSPVFADDGCSGDDASATHAASGRMGRGGPDGGQEGGRRGPPPPLSELLADNAAELGLSAESLAEVEDILTSEEPAIRSLHEEARAAKEAGDEAAARAAMQAAHDAQRMLMEEVEAVLTEDELASLRTLLPPPPRMHGPGQDGEGRGPSGRTRG
ncbi:MAG: hypothetical protein H6742_17520 [Alphaproteobacteria bacterium]|nr:hypothetical protein [Alphaproteobacteria bacterium]